MDLSGWKSIDIYLFTNGQEQSPPRKYHLTDDELDMWDDTLSKLGVSQNGYVNQPIEIYTLNGIKISNPMELKNGGTYVAVNLGETFISARYKRYIMKATRSWEKRKVKKFVELSSTPKTTDIQEENGDLGKSSRREVIINIENLYKQNNSDFSLRKSRAKSPYEAESLPSPDTCNIVDSTLRHSPWYDDVNIHKVQNIEKGIFKGCVKKRWYKNTQNSVRSAKSIMNSQESKKNPPRKLAPGLPIKKKVVPKSAHSPMNAAKGRKIPASTAHKTSPFNKNSRPQLKGKKSTPSNRSLRSNDTKTSDTPTEVNKWRNDAPQFTSDSEQSKDQQKSDPVKEAADKASSESRLENPPEPRQRWSLNDDVINSAPTSRDQTPTPINRNLSNPVNNPVKQYQPNQPEVRTQKNYILLKPDNTAIIVDENTFKSMSPDELNQYISYGAINKIAPPGTNNDQVKDAEEPVTAAPPPALLNDMPDYNRQRSASTSSRKSVNIDDTNIQHIPPSPREYEDGKSTSPELVTGKEFSREQIYNSIYIQILDKNKPNPIVVSEGMCTSSYVQTFLPPAINVDLRGRSLYKQNPRNVDMPILGPICADTDYPSEVPGSLFPKCSNLYNVTFNPTGRVPPPKPVDEKRTVHDKNVSFSSAKKEGVDPTSMGPSNVNVPQPTYKSHTHRLSEDLNNSPYKIKGFPKYSNKYDHVPPKVITRHTNKLDDKQDKQIRRQRSKSADGRSTKVDKTFSSTSANTEIRKRLPQTQSPRHVDISQLNPQRTVSRYTSFTPSNDPDIQKFNSKAASTKSDGNLNLTMKSAFPQVKSSQSSQSISKKGSLYHDNSSNSNNKEQRSPSYFPRDLSKAPIQNNMLPNIKSISTSPINTMGPTEKSISTSPIKTKSPTENLRNLSQVRPNTPSNSISGKSFPYGNVSNNNDQRNKSPPSQIPRQLNIPQQRPNGLIPRNGSNRFTFTTPENIVPDVKSAATSPVSTKSPNEATKNQTISDKRFPYRNNHTNLTNNTQQYKPPPAQLPQINIPQRPKSPIPLESNRNIYKAPPISTRQPNEASTNQNISERKLLSTNNQKRNRIPLRQVNIPQQRPNSPVSTDPPTYLNDYRNKLPQSDPSGRIKKSFIKPMQAEATDIRDFKSDFINKNSPSVKYDSVTTDQPRKKWLANPQLNKTNLSVDNTVSSSTIKEYETSSQTKPKLDDVNNIDIDKNVLSDNMKPNLVHPNTVPSNTIKESETLSQTKPKLDEVNNIENVLSDNMKPNLDRPESTRNFKSDMIKVGIPQLTLNDNMSPDISKETESSFYKTESPQSPQTEFLPITIIQQDTIKPIDKNINNSKESEPSFNKTKSPQSEISPIIIIQQDPFETIDKNVNDSKETESSFDKRESPQTKIPSIIIIQQAPIVRNVNNSYPFNDNVSRNQTNSELADYTQLFAQPTVKEIQYVKDNDTTDENQLKDLTKENEKTKDDTYIKSKNAIGEQSNFIDNKILDELNLKNSEAVVDTNRGDAFSENEFAKRSSVGSAGKITPTVNQPVSDDAGAKNEITAVVGKGDIFNLKLNLSGKNVEGLITIDKANKDESPQTMNLNQGSQTNLNIMFKEKPTNEETATDVSCSASESGNRMPNVIVVQCACCENVNIEELRRTLPKALDNYKGDPNKCIVFLPTDSKCAEKNRDALSPYANSDNGCKDFADKCECEIPENLQINKNGVHYPEDEVKPYRMYSESEDESKVPPPATSTPNDNVVKILPQCTDSTTQTDWQDALLIPVIHDDGHITFKFPSLETVKNM